MLDRGHDPRENDAKYVLEKIILFNSKTEQSEQTLRQTDRLTEFLHTWCANSCDTTTATRCLLLSEDTPSLKSKAVSRYVIKPQFSMAPDEKSGMAIISELENMVGVSGIQYIIDYT